DVHLVTDRARLTNEFVVEDAAQERAGRSTCGEVVVETSGCRHRAHGFHRTQRFGPWHVGYDRNWGWRHHSLSSNSKYAMSVISPLRSARQCGVTRAPVATASGPDATTMWTMAVSAPSSLMSAQAKG